MSNVLLTSIGTGSYNRENKSKKYSEATYVMENKKEEVVSAYIYDALIEYRSIDKIIFIGTAGSNWHMMSIYLMKIVRYNLFLKRMRLMQRNSWN